MCRNFIALAVVLGLTQSVNPVAAADYTWPVVKVIDGDTVKVNARADFPDELSRLSVQLRGVDTPEKGFHAKCTHERLAGQAATEFTRSEISGASKIVIRDPAWGKWAGRVVADVIIDGRSLSDSLIAAGHGREYNGGPRAGWCG